MPKEPADFNIGKINHIKALLESLEGKGKDLFSEKRHEAISGLKTGLRKFYGHLNYYENGKYLTNELAAEIMEVGVRISDLLEKENLKPRESNEGNAAEHQIVEAAE